MTSIVGIKCKDGVVIGADSAATSSDGGRNKTMEVATSKKISIIDSQIIIAQTGSVGHAQRFTAVIEEQWEKKVYSGKSALEIGKLMSAQGIRDFMETLLQHVPLSALVAFPAKKNAELCELCDGTAGFQPELKDGNDLWFCSSGSGQPITDPFLALLRKVYWPDGPPNLAGGIFTAVWALMHVCEINPGGINEPIHIAVLSEVDGKVKARMLSEEELQEHRNMVEEAMKHMASFRDILEGKNSPSAVPLPPEKSS